MNHALDRLSLVFGHSLPGPLRLLATVVWWAVFVIAIASVWPSDDRPGAGIIESFGLTPSLPSANIAVPIIVVLTAMVLVHRMAVERRNRLLGRRCDPRDGAIGEQPASQPWLLKNNRHIWLVVALAVVGFTFVILKAEGLLH